MAVRLVVSITAAPGKGAELAQAMKGRCEISRKDAGCEEFEVFQSALNPDRLVLLERWSSQAALDAHGQLQRTRPALPPGLRQGDGEREDYEYNRTR
jgi:quinol monooxygenase YgiN